MLCPMCGADVPESQFCQNCGAPFAVAGATPSEPVPTPYEPASAPDEPASAPPTPPSTEQRGVYQWNDVPQDADAGQYAAKAPNTAFILSVVGLLLGVLGFSLVTIVPGIICCIAGLVLNAKYSREGKENPRKTPTLVMGVAGIVIAAIMAVLFLFLGTVATSSPDESDSADSKAAQVAGESEASSSAAASEAASSSKSSAAAASESASSSSAGSSSASSAAQSGASANAAGSQKSSSASAAAIDARAFDANGNPSLFALLELDGDELQDALEASGFIWIDNARTWMSSSGALVEAQDLSGLMKKEDIARLDEGADGSAVVFVTAASGYETPQDALDGLSGDITLKDTFTGSDSDIVFAIASVKGSEDHLIAISKTDDGQQTALVFTEQAVEEGLFADITGVDAGDNIQEIWKVLTAQG